MNPEKLKIFFFGSPSIAVPSLISLSTCEEVEIIGVGVFPDKKIGRKQTLTPSPVKQIALNLGLKIYEISSKKDLVEIISKTEFDLGIVIAFGMIFPEKILSPFSKEIETKYKKEFINVHFSLLPEWRGASPVQSAILKGQTNTGITWQRMVFSLDAGNILLQKKYNISNMNTQQVWKYFAEKTAENFPDFIHRYQNNDFQESPQINEEATFCSKFTKKDGLINFQKDSAKKIFRHFLALTPWPGIYAETKYGPLKLKKISLTQKKFSHKISCANVTEIWIERAQRAGKKEMPIKEILNGYPDIFS